MLIPSSSTSSSSWSGSTCGHSTTCSSLAVREYVVAPLLMFEGPEVKVSVSDFRTVASFLPGFLNQESLKAGTQ